MNLTTKIKYKSYKLFSKILCTTLNSRLDATGFDSIDCLKFSTEETYIGDFDDASFSNISINNRVTKRFERPETCIYKNVSALGEYPIVFTENNNIIVSSMVDEDIFTLNVLGNMLDLLDTKISFQPEQENGAFFLLFNQRASNYYHWHLENLIKFQGVKMYENRTGVEVTPIVNSNISDWQLDTLKLFGYKKSDLHYWKGGHKKFDEVVTVSNLRHRPRSVNWLREEMKTTSKSHEDIIYISREDADKRKVEDQHELQDLLDRNDIEIFIPGENSLLEQIERLSSAKFIIGPHGAGLTNMLHSKENTHVLELMPSDDIRTQYFNLANMLGHEYSYILCDTTKSNLEVDVGQVEDIIIKIKNEIEYGFSD